MKINLPCGRAVKNVYGRNLITKGKYGDRLLHTFAFINVIKTT